ncbi:MAG: ImmA/IrrE family metallo-endopeptidase [Bacteroidetes bacterium]|nr:ImmA/IrrE family metallo-endopeptidase [Bacteroidota bacterium]
MQNYNIEEGPSTLGALRALIPQRSCTFTEALRVAELQASRLLTLLRVEQAPIPSEIISELPRIQVEYRPIPMSGLSYWNGTVWVIGLNRAEPPTRQRFTLLHEYKHIIDHGRVEALYPGSSRHSADRQAEQAADFFAGCALMPRLLLKRAWANGLQTPAQLAHHFETSELAICVRLAQVGLVDNTDRHGGQAIYRRESAPLHLAKETRVKLEGMLDIERTADVRLGVSRKVKTQGGRDGDGYSLPQQRLNHGPADPRDVTRA